MTRLNDDELRAIRERYERGKSGPPLNDGPFSHSLQREFAVNESWADIPRLLAHAAALQDEVGRLEWELEKHRAFAAFTANAVSTLVAGADVEKRLNEIMQAYMALGHVADGD